MALSRLGRFPGVRWVLLANGLAAALVLLVSRPGLGRVGQWIRELYPLVLAFLLYGSLDLLAGHGGISTYEPLVQSWETRLFGGQVSRTWGTESPSRFWSGLLHAVYASYYGVVAAGPVWFTIRNDQTNLRRSVAVISTTFGICFLAFLFFPVAGPNYEFPPPAAEFRDNFPARLVYSLLERGSSYGAAFPSSHVAVALAAALVALRASRSLGLVLLVPALILPFAVVYIQMHYAVDALAGVVVGAGVYGGWRLGESLGSEKQRAGPAGTESGRSRPP